MSRRKISVLQILLSKFFRLFYYSTVHDLAVLDLSKFRPRTNASSNNLFSSRLEEKDLTILAKQFGAKFVGKYHKLKDRATCIIGYSQKEPVGYQWYTSHPKEKEGVRPLLYDICPKKDSVYIFGAYALENKRHFFLVKSLFAGVLEDIKKTGYKQAITTTSIDTPGVKVMLARFGFQYIGQLKYRRWLFFVSKDISALKEVSDGPFI